MLLCDDEVHRDASWWLPWKQQRRRPECGGYRALIHLEEEQRTECERGAAAEPQCPGLPRRRLSTTMPRVFTRWRAVQGCAATTSPNTVLRSYLLTPQGSCIKHLQGGEVKLPHATNTRVLV